MWTAVLCFSLLEKHKSKKASAARRGLLFHIWVLFFRVANRIFAGIAWLDARIVPLPLATVLLIRATKQQ